ncbi:MAG: hypothetical protein HWD61_06850 [Parachlamydiaceae bacterium]|nr:MAG: hypothetical protein HWD61_06850 [Parachlamydiaceae bacterium]
MGISGTDICQVLHYIGNAVTKTYQCVGAYLYPSKEKSSEYESAKFNARLSASRFAEVLADIVKIAQCVDILTYGLGIFK